MKKLILILTISLFSITLLSAQEFNIGAGFTVNSEKNKFSDEADIGAGFFLHAMYINRITPKSGLALQANVMNTFAELFGHDSYSSIEISPLWVWTPLTSKGFGIETGITLGYHFNLKPTSGVLPEDLAEINTLTWSVPLYLSATANRFNYKLGYLYHVTNLGEGVNEPMRRHGLRVIVAFRIL